MNVWRDRIAGERWVLLALSFVPLALSLPCFFGHAWAEGDLVRQFCPWKELGRLALQAGHLPLWNPYVYCGMPLLGNFQSGLAYPFHLPFYFLDFVPALGWHLLFHFFVTGLGFYAFSRAFGLGRGPALIAALAWQGNAFLLARVEFMSALSAYAWTPWILWFVVARRNAALGACLIGLQALSGYPLEMGYTLIASCIFAYLLGQGRMQRLALAWGLGLCAGALQLLPGLELMHLSSRLAGGIDARVTGLIGGMDFMQWIWPVQRQPWMSAFSLSIPVLGMAVFARGRQARWAWAFVLLGLALGMGVADEIFPNRHPSVALVFCSLGAALLAGLGAQALQERLNGKAYAFLSAVILAQALVPWFLRGDLVQSRLYQPSSSAQFMAAHIQPGARIMLSPAVQLEVDSQGPTSTDSWSRFSQWLQANTSAPTGLHDANGYDPLEPSAVVKFLNASSFPVFDKNSSILNLLGVEAVVDWDPQAGRFTPALIRRSSKPWRGMVVGDSQKDWLDLDKAVNPESLSLNQMQGLTDISKRWPAMLHENDPGSVTLTLPSGHPSGWAFLNDTYYPGWQAEVDGVPVTIHRALGAFRAVQVPERAKEVTMQYRPLSVRLGIALSLIGWITIFMLGRAVGKRNSLEIAA